MNILVVGGGGQVGAYVTVYLSSLGYNVTIAGRRRPTHVPQLNGLPFVSIDYVKDETTKEQLSPFEVIVFAAGADSRHVPKGEDVGKYLLHTNGVVVPSFAKLAREAGVKQFIHIGSFYWHAMPELAESNTYMKSRKLAAKNVAALATEFFSATSLDPPYIVGSLPGTEHPWDAPFAHYAQSKNVVSPIAPLGGVNFISVRSLSEAISGAIQHRSEISGKVLAFGDENHTWEEFFALFFRAVGRDDVTVKASEEDNPVFPNIANNALGKMISFDTSAETHRLLGNYRRNDVYNAVVEVVKQNQ